MISLGAIVKSIALRIEAIARVADFRLGLAADVLLGQRRKPIPVPIPVRRKRDIR